MSQQPALDNLKDLRAKGIGSPPAVMRGFDPQYTDIVDYIVRVTHRIWEEGDMGYIYDTYLHNVTVHTAYGTAYGVEDVVAGSVAFLAALPDRQMYAEDVIWHGDDEAGFHTSHLIASTGTNTGYSPWGPPTSKRVSFLAIANCFIKQNRIIEEWLVRDTGALVRQLGYDLWDVAKDAVPFLQPAVSGETDRLQGQLPPAQYQAQYQVHYDTHTDSRIEDVVRGHFHDVWNRRHFNRIAEHYAPDAHLHVSNMQIHGASNIRAYHLNFIAMFPDAHLSVEHIYWLGDEESGYRVAVRWRFAGTHARYGLYGAPTNRRVNVLGISHVHLKNDKITKQYLVFDELALVMQLVAKENR